MSTPVTTHGWLTRSLLAPGEALHDLAHALVSPLAIPAITAVAGVLMMVRVLAGVRRRRLGAGARLITVMTPPQVDSKAATAVWLHLTGQLRPAWQRTLFGQPHLGFEYTITPENGAAIRFWVPGSVPPGLVERAIASAWPGAHTDTQDCTEPPLPRPAGTRRVLAGGQLRLGRREALPIRTDHAGDLVRDLITAADDLGPGQGACVQVLARPVTGRRVARATRSETTEMVRFVDEQRGEHGVQPVCVVIGFASSTYYAAKKRQSCPSQRDIDDAEILERIRAVWEGKGRRKYGAKKVWKQLLRQGFQIGRGRVERLMRTAGMTGVVGVRRHPRTKVAGAAADLSMPTQS